MSSNDKILMDFIKAARECGLSDEEIAAAYAKASADLVVALPGLLESIRAASESVEAHQKALTEKLSKGASQSDECSPLFL